ncbi:M23 family metallopeptidase [Mycolicibacterium komossense]|uniref:M23 family metallopeptidase n=1 Tax=Mycolicibacterium komossense TaxID=1779 RepID=UPI0023DE7B29
MPQHRSTPSPSAGVSKNARNRWLDQGRDLDRNEVTDIIPFNEFGSLDDFDFRDGAFDGETAVLRAPELDDLHDVDDLTPFTLMRRTDIDCVYDPDITDVIPRVAAHRKPTNSGALKGRVLIAAMAAGAAAAAAHSAINPSDTASAQTVLAAGQTALNTGAITGTSQGMQVVAVSSVANASVHSEEIANASAFAQERAEREARLQRPLFVKPTQGIYTSGFGYRWGALHGGIDLANAIGTPIVAATDGVVTDVGPTAGYGAWVKVRANDGTVTLYGHVNTWLVSVGQRVMAGDEIATIGNRGNSTGPHCHFEVLLNGTDRIDPVPWLAQRGITVGAYEP